MKHEQTHPRPHRQPERNAAAATMSCFTRGVYSTPWQGRGKLAAPKPGNTWGFRGVDWHWVSISKNNIEPSLYDAD